MAPSAALADAAATAVGNAVKSEEDVDAALGIGRRIRAVSGIVVIAGSKLGVWGDVRLMKL
jgi:ApbE superfamily uncharacterized protein (UPF0280 family)